MKVQVAVFATLLVCLSAATHLTEKVIAEELLKNMGFEEGPNMKKVWIFRKKIFEFMRQKSILEIYHNSIWIFAPNIIVKNLQE